TGTHPTPWSPAERPCSRSTSWRAIAASYRSSRRKTTPRPSPPKLDPARSGSCRCRHDRPSTGTPPLGSVAGRPPRASTGRPAHLAASGHAASRADHGNHRSRGVLVSVVALGSVRGAPGVTTTALLLASCLDGALLVEADLS